MWDAVTLAVRSAFVLALPSAMNAPLRVVQKHGLKYAQEEPRCAAPRSTMA